MHQPTEASRGYCELLYVYESEGSIIVCEQLFPSGQKNGACATAMSNGAFCPMHGLGAYRVLTKHFQGNGRAAEFKRPVRALTVKNPNFKRKHNIKIKI